MSSFFSKTKNTILAKQDHYLNEPELDILVKKGDTLHVLLLLLLFIYSFIYTAINYFQVHNSEMIITSVPLFFVVIE